jgi:integrase
MANIKVVQRKVNKSEEQPLSVRYSHPNGATKKNEDFFISTGVIVAPKHFKDGRVVGLQNAPELNENIRAITTRVEQAVRDIQADGGEPEVKYVKQAYHMRPAIIEKLKSRHVDFVADGKSDIEILEHEISLLEAQIQEKRTKITEIQLQIGTYKPTNFVQLIEKMIVARTKDADAEKSGANVKRKRGDKSAKLAKNTINAYTNFLTNVKGWDSTISITDITKESVESFVKYCIKQEYYNHSTFLFVQKFNSVMAYYAKTYDISDSYKEYVFDYPLKEGGVLYLTTSELKAFRNVEYNHWNSAAVEKYKKVKDMCLLLSETGLRLRDAELSRGDISDGYISKRQGKTGGKVQIRFTSRMKAICEKYDYKLIAGNTGYFNDAFRTMLSMCNVPSLFESVTTVNFIGHKRIEDTRMKWEHLTAHDLRRTMINQCLLRGLRYDQITRMTGHKDFQTFSGYIDRDTTLEKMDEVFDFLNEDDDKPVMKVA